MTLVVVGRPGLRDPKFLAEFFAAAVAVVEQATSADGAPMRSRGERLPHRARCGRRNVALDV